MNFPSVITREWLTAHPDCVFVFGDNLLRRGTKGAAALRSLPNSYGFVTKRRPSYDADAYYKPSDYPPIFERELKRLEEEITAHPEKTYLISKLGAGLANRHHIFEKIIRPGLGVLKGYSNVVLL